MGDSCESATDCEQKTLQVCDTSLPGGYCTVFDCVAGGCPAEAACIGFQAAVASAVECRQLQSRPRLQRSACMLECSRNSDCRGEYVCQQLGENPWSATSLEGRSVSRVCVPVPPEAAVGDSGYCRAGASTRSQPLPLVDLQDAGVASLVPDAAATEAAVDAALIDSAQ